jgi:hypothetical protein
MRLHIILVGLSLWLGLKVAAQENWQFGFALSAGAMGPRFHESAPYFSSFTGEGITEMQSLPTLALGGGIWLQRRMGARWGIQLGLQYRRLEYQLRHRIETYTSTHTTTFSTTNQRQLLQQAVILPLSLRYYLRARYRRLRPFVGVQASLAYYLKGTLLTKRTLYNPPIHRRWAESLALDLSSDFYEATPWQGLYGAQFGLQVAPFTISIWYQRNFFAPLNDYAACLSQSCLRNAGEHPDFYQLFASTQLQIAYIW